MAIKGPIPVEFELVFPHGCYAVGQVEAVRDFEASRNGAFVQQKDKVTALPIWTVVVNDADPEITRPSQKVITVKLIAKTQPVLPPAPAGWPVVPVEFEQMAVTPWVTDGGRLAYSIRAGAIRSPKAGKPASATRDGA